MRIYKYTKFFRLSQLMCIYKYTKFFRLSQLMRIYKYTKFINDQSWHMLILLVFDNSILTAQFSLLPSCRTESTWIALDRGLQRAEA